MINIIFENCEGKDSSNYTLVATGTLSSDCMTITSAVDYLVSCEKKGEKEVNGLHLIMKSQDPVGGKIIKHIQLEESIDWINFNLAYHQIQSLFLVTYGPLQGKYVFLKVIYLSAAYLKKCSSVLGYSYVSSKSAVLLIVEKLDLNTFISPTGDYEILKKSATTMCKGKFYLFWSDLIDQDHIWYWVIKKLWSSFVRVSSK